MRKEKGKRKKRRKRWRN